MTTSIWPYTQERSTACRFLVDLGTGLPLISEDPDSFELEETSRELFRRLLLVQHELSSHTYSGPSSHISGGPDTLHHSRCCSGECIRLVAPMFSTHVLTPYSRVIAARDSSHRDTRSWELEVKTHLCARCRGLCLCYRSSDCIHQPGHFFAC